MSYENFAALDGSIQEKLDADTDFQASIADLSDEDKETTIKTRKSELMDEEIANWNAKTKKSEELANNYKTRAEKAEQDAKKAKPAQSGAQESTLSQKDLIVLMKSNVAEEDIEEIVEFATFKKISIADALKSSTVKSILAEKAEIRKSAEATATGSQRRGSSKVSDETLLANAAKGEIPEKGTPEAEQLFWARRKKK